MTPVLVSVFSAIIAVLSLAFNYFTLRKRRDLEKASEIARLHQLWWSAEIKSARERVIKYVRDWERSGDRDTPVLRSYTSNEGFEDERMLIGRIAYFFSDLNAYIAEGLASESFA